MSMVTAHLDECLAQPFGRERQWLSIQFDIKRPLPHPLQHLLSALRLIIRHERHIIW